VRAGFTAAILARTTVGIVGIALATATRSAALNGTTASLDDIRALITEGFALVATSSGSAEGRATGARL
jgi:hypothetical protein